MSLVFIIAGTGPYWLDGEVNVRYRAEIAMTGLAEGSPPTTYPPGEPVALLV